MTGQPEEIIAVSNVPFVTVHDVEAPPNEAHVPVPLNVPVTRFDVIAEIVIVPTVIVHSLRNMLVLPAFGAPNMM